MCFLVLVAYFSINWVPTACVDVADMKLLLSLEIPQELEITVQRDKSPSWHVYVLQHFCLLLRFLSATSIILWWHEILLLFNLVHPILKIIPQGEVFLVISLDSKEPEDIIVSSSWHSENFLMNFSSSNKDISSLKNNYDVVHEVSITKLKIPCEVFIKQL